MSAHGWGEFGGADPHYSSEPDDAYADTEPCPRLTGACAYCGGPSDAEYCGYACLEDAAEEEARAIKADEDGEMDREEA